MARGRRMAHLARPKGGQASWVECKYFRITWERFFMYLSLHVRVTCKTCGKE